MKSKWVYSVKYNDDGSVKLFKARWVGCGYSQIEGVDYHNTYGSTLPITPVRLFFAAACINDWDVTEIDTVKAFTQAVFDNDEKLYIEQPHYMEVDNAGTLTATERCYSLWYLWPRNSRCQSRLSGTYRHMFGQIKIVRTT